MTRDELKQLIRETIEEISSDQVRGAAKFAASVNKDPQRAERLFRAADLKDRRLVMQAIERGRLAYNKRYEDQNKPAPFPKPFTDAQLKYKFGPEGDERVGNIIAANGTGDYVVISDLKSTEKFTIEVNDKGKFSVNGGNTDRNFIAFNRESRFLLLLLLRGLGNTEISQNNIINY